VIGDTPVTTGQTLTNADGCPGDSGYRRVAAGNCDNSRQALHIALKTLRRIALSTLENFHVCSLYSNGFINT
jgi:hypothetical protein